MDTIAMDVSGGAGQERIIVPPRKRNILVSMGIFTLMVVALGAFARIRNEVASAPTLQSSVHGVALASNTFIHLQQAGDNGLLQTGLQEQTARLVGSTSTTECEEAYGVLPCSTSLGGNIFLMLTYGYLLLIAAQLISEGSEMLLLVLDPGIIGGLLLPVLGAFPDTLLIAVACAGGTPEEAQEQVLVGMGVLAGSTIMILTIAWGGSILCGRCDLEPDSQGAFVAKDRKLTRPLDVFSTGVTCDDQTRLGAILMMMSVIPYIIMQIPLIFGDSKLHGRTAALIGLILAGAGLIAYCTYQVLSPWLQQKKIQDARLQFIRSAALRDINNLAADKSWGGLLQEDGRTPNVDTLNKIFDHFDQNSDMLLDASELKALILGLGIRHQGSVPEEEEVKTWMRDFDKNADGSIHKSEFAEGMARWIRNLTQKTKNNLMEAGAQKFGIQPSLRPPSINTELESQADTAKGELELLQSLEDEDDDDEETSKEKTSAEIYRDALILMIGGAALVAVFADPMVDSIQGFSTASGIPPFFVAFVVSPIASNASELVSSLIFAMKKRKRTSSLCLSQVYGAITMNNTMCLGVFLGMVYFRALQWEFSAEVTVILICTLLVGLLGGSSTTFKTWTSIPVLLLYPFSLALVCFLDYDLGWK
eukprot:TRINITY_DN401_c0_g1_i6.p1 TRINITY_DN401_c0_g1~~TRINITY_DN401_c0_g1_i6.p1  ORF type:complete len:648 (+),score=189.53 TRINITY_DN401_c0_g1_i6:189-2132(+)